MADEIIIRRCLEDDIESVLELWRIAGSTPSVTDTSHDLRVTLASPASSLMVAESSGRIVGSIIAAFDGWRGNLYRLAVNPDYQRRGIARRLVSEAEQWLRGQESGGWPRWRKKTILGPPVSGNPLSLSLNRWT